MKDYFIKSIFLKIEITISEIRWSQSKSKNQKHPIRNYLLFTSKVNLSFSNPHTRPSAFRKPPKSFHPLKVTHLQLRHPALSLGLAKSLTACFVSKVLLEHSHAPLFVNGLRLLLSCCNRDCMTQKT